MIFKRFIGFFVFAFLIHNATAQNKTVTHENQQWLQYYNETKLNRNWTLLADASFRWRDDFNQNSQFIARAGLGYSIKKTLGFLVVLRIPAFIPKIL